jgi:hypothetical protein
MIIKNQIVFPVSDLGGDNVIQLTVSNRPLKYKYLPWKDQVEVLF